MNSEQVYAEIRDLTEQASFYHEQGRHALSLQCYQKAITHAAPLGDANTMALLLAEAGQEHRDCDNYYHAIDLMIAALALVQDDEEAVQLRARIKKLLAITFRDIFGPEKLEVLQLLEESRMDYLHSGNEVAEANVLQHIASCYLELKRFPEADSMLQIALLKAGAAQNVQLQGWILNDMASLEIERNEWGIALEYATNAREKICSQQDLEGEADTWITEAHIMLKMGHFEQALAAAKRASELYTQNQNQRRTINASRHTANILAKLGRIDEAVSVLNTSLKILERLDLYYEQAMVYLNLGKLNIELKNYGLAYQQTMHAHSFAEQEGLSNLLEVSDELLRRCRKGKD